MSFQIGGLQKVSLIDYPGKVAAVVFAQGCNFRCPFCHNRELVLPAYYQPPLPEPQVLTYLAERRDKLQGVVVTGGEPTLQKDLVGFLRKIKRLKYSIKLDTNGSQPRVLRPLIRAKLVDFIAMDLKGPWERYEEFTGCPVNIRDIQTSVRIILKSGVGHIFRTTAVKPLLSPDDIRRTAGICRPGGRYVVQEFIPRDTVLNFTLLDRGHYTKDEIGSLQKDCQRQEVAV